MVRQRETKAFEHGRDARCAKGIRPHQATAPSSTRLYGRANKCACLKGHGLL